MLWIGPARVAGAQAPMYACGACISELQERVWQSFFNESRPAGSTRPSESAEVGQSTSGRRTGKHRGESRLFRRS
ncbi:hypothetical protein QFZ71_003246 [Streptomyces sp. V2I9]|nr:hypothetical protein [Streptomyces sp. V2I9]